MSNRDTFHKEAVQLLVGHMVKVYGDRYGYALGVMLRMEVLAFKSVIQ